MRAEFGENVWVEAFKNKVQRLEVKGVEYIIVPDWRFFAEALEDNPNVYRIRIKGMYDADADADNHRSETELDNYENFDLVIDNSTHPAEEDIVLPDFVK
jgi:hypothetical protein